MFLPFNARLVFDPSQPGHRRRFVSGNAAGSFTVQGDRGPRPGHKPLANNFPKPFERGLQIAHAAKRFDDFKDLIDFRFRRFAVGANVGVTVPALLPGAVAAIIRRDSMNHVWPDFNAALGEDRDDFRRRFSGFD
jgi:hypothetical protein